MAEIKWLNSALIDLNEIFVFIASHSEKHANRQVEKITDAVKGLANQPEMGRIVPELNNPGIREITIGHYRIVYRLMSRELIHIILIHHSARDLTSRF